MIKAMNELLLLISTRKEAYGLCVCDLTGSLQHVPFKAPVAAGHGIALIPGHTSGYSGVSGTNHDHIIIAQQDKPVLSIFQYGKSAGILQCPMQEIITTLALDYTGNILILGTKKGFLYSYMMRTGVLVGIWQGHLKGVNKVVLSSLGGDYLVSAGDDGLVRVWDMASVMQSSTSNSAGNKQMTPYRSWSAHTVSGP